MDSDVTIARVREVIDRSGLTQSEFAAKAGLDASKMSKSLGGVRRLTSLDLANIADVGSVTVDWLLGVAGPAPALAARSETTGRDATRAAVDHAGRLAQLRADLAGLGYPPPTPYTLATGDGTAVDQGSAAASDAIRFVREHGGEPTSRDLATTIEAHFGVDVAIVNVGTGCDGLAWHDDRVRLIIAATSMLPTRPPTRQRFTLAHELGHILLGDDQKLHVDEDVTPPSDQVDSSEVRANAFAAAFLLPEEDLRDEFRSDGMSEDELRSTIAELVMRFSVSPSALVYRLRNLQLLPLHQARQVRDLTTHQCAALVGRRGELADWIQDSMRSRQPTGLVRDTFVAYLDGKSTTRPFANLVGIDSDELQRQLDAIEGWHDEGVCFVP